MEPGRVVPMVPACGRAEAEQGLQRGVEGWVQREFLGAGVTIKDDFYSHFGMRPGFLTECVSSQGCPGRKQAAFLLPDDL